MEKKTQTSEVLRYMKTHKKGITSKDAFELFGATRLSGLIFVLKRQGYNINTEYINANTRYGNKVLIARYSLVNEPKTEKK